MKVLPRTHFGNPILRVRAKNVSAASVKSTSFKNLLKNMFYTMNRVHGVGLAAPQIGKSLKLAVIRVPGLKLRKVIINPKITWHSKQKSMDWEGCLSFPSVRGQVPRWQSIQVEYINEKGKKVREKHSGFAARVFQHEIDHLNGTVYVDRMSDMKTLMTEKELIKNLSATYDRLKKTK